MTEQEVKAEFDRQADERINPMMAPTAYFREVVAIMVGIMAKAISDETEETDSADNPEIVLSFRARQSTLVMLEKLKKSTRCDSIDSVLHQAIDHYDDAVRRHAKRSVE